MRAASSSELAERMAHLARALTERKTLDEVLDEVTSAAVELIPGADTAGILLVEPGGGFDSLATRRRCPTSWTSCR